PLPLGDSTALRTGDKVVFAGGAGGTQPAVREGIVKRRARNIFGLAYLQIDGAVGPGTSGPLVDMHGRVVGVGIAKAQPGQGAAYVLPVNYVYSGAARL